MADPLYDVEYWLSRAEEARTVGALARNPETKRIMAEIVASYERLAQLARDRVLAQKPKPDGQ
jgi:hypothetical protein